MLIKLSPIRSDKTLTIEKTGDILTVNGESFDFSPIPEGGLLPQDAVTSDVILSDVERIDGEITLTARLPIGPDAPEHVRFPTEPYHLDTDRKVILA